MTAKVAEMAWWMEVLAVVLVVVVAGVPVCVQVSYAPAARLRRPCLFFPSTKR